MNIMTQKSSSLPSTFEQKEVSILHKFDALLFAHVMLIQSRRQIASCIIHGEKKIRSHISNLRRDFSVKLAKTRDH
jgi:hypothetical protein